jgi:L-threonylcarbamoyladenylate synthase
MADVLLAELIADACAGTTVIAFPTDTVPALAVRPDRSEQIYALKQRQPDKPLILMGADADDLWPYVSGSPDALRQWQTFAEQHWPGALTLVLPASNLVPAAINQGTDTIGIRVPNHPLARYILGFTGPLATTSANRSGQPPLMDLDAIATEFPTVEILSSETLERNQPEFLAYLPTTATSEDFALCYGSGLPSTVARWRNNNWEILRQGAIKL